MQKIDKKSMYRRSQEDRRKIHTFILDDRRSGPYCRRQAKVMMMARENQPEYWDWRLGEWITQADISK